jgi:hypothetical protein
MTCHKLAPGVIVCKSPATEYRRIVRCPSCRRRRRFLVRFEGWYGDRLTCTGCGNQWSDGYRMPLTRSAKKRAALIADAKARWATARPAAQYQIDAAAYWAPYMSERAEVAYGRSQHAEVR